MVWLSTGHVRLIWKPGVMKKLKMSWIISEMTRAPSKVTRPPTVTTRNRATYFSRLVAGSIRKLSRCNLVFMFLKMQDANT